MEEDKKFCRFCGAQIPKESIVCTKCGRQLEVVKEVKEKQEKTEDKVKFYQQQWFMWIMLVFFAPVGIILMWKFNNTMKKNTKIILSIVFGIFFLIMAFSETEETPTTSDSTLNNSVSIESNVKKVEVADFSSMAEIDILKWCKDNNLNCQMKREYSDTVAKDGYIKQSVNAKEQVDENTKIIITFSLGKEPTTEQKNALKKAQAYSKTMHMSKQGIYDQLVSEYGEKFPADAAQYAIDNLEVDWNANALAKAKSYQQTLNMSKQAIYDQLVSAYGEKFTPSEAQYAIDNLE